MSFPTISDIGNKREYLVTFKVTFTKKYVVEARDWEVAEEYAEDELYADSFSIMKDEYVDVDVYETEEL